MLLADTRFCGEHGLVLDILRVTPRLLRREARRTRALLCVCSALGVATLAIACTSTEPIPLPMPGPARDGAAASTDVTTGLDSGVAP